MPGYWGKILKVDLDKGKTEEWKIDEELYRKHLGGSGLAARLFFQLKGYSADPLGPGNPLLIMNGPMSGTTFPGSSRLEVCARSPLTNIWGESSMGGNLSPDLKGTGYDGVVILGTSENPVYLWLSEDGAEIKDASHLWGKTTFETEEMLKVELGDKKVKVMSIGPGGENLVKYAAIVNDRGSLAGRTGMGAVMGSKRLKAVAVRGKRKAEIADNKAYRQVRKKVLEEIKASLSAEALHDFGSNVYMEMGMAISDVPVKNWRAAQWQEGAERLSGPSFSESILIGTGSCYACPIGCKRIVEIKGGKYEIWKGPGPEYEGVASLGTLLYIDDLEAVAKANSLANAYGIDVISTGSAIAYAIEAFQEGVINEKETSGFRFGWNRPDDLVELVHMIAHREGFGNELAEGVRAMSEKYGGEEFAIHVKGLEVPMHDPRALWGMALSYATSIRGACHVNDDNLYLEPGMHNLKEWGYSQTKPQRSDGKALQTIHAQRMGQIASCSVICIYTWLSMGHMKSILEAINAVTGYDCSIDDFMDVADRNWYLKRALGNLCGADAEDDRVPQRILVPHLEGYTSNLARVLNPLARLMGKAEIRNEKIVEISKQFSRKYFVPNTFKIITFFGKLIPSIWVSDWRFRRADVKEIRRRYVDFDRMLKDYYRLRQLNEKGYPEREVLERFGLEDVAETLFSEQSDSE